MGKPHDDAARRQARQVYETHGAQAAADTTGIPLRTIQHWATTQHWPRSLASAQPSPGKMAAHAQAARLGWHTRRRLLADQLGNVGAELLEAIQRELAQRKRVNLRDAGILLGIMLDKAELLNAATGGAGGASETMDDGTRAAEVQRILHDWWERAEAGRGR